MKLDKVYAIMDSLYLKRSPQTLDSETLGYLQDKGLVKVMDVGSYKSLQSQYTTLDAEVRTFHANFKETEATIRTLEEKVGSFGFFTRQKTIDATNTELSEAKKTYESLKPQVTTYNANLEKVKGLKDELGAYVKTSLGHVALTQDGRDKICSFYQNKRVVQKAIETDNSSNVQNDDFLNQILSTGFVLTTLYLANNSTGVVIEHESEPIKGMGGEFGGAGASGSWEDTRIPDEVEQASDDSSDDFDVD